MLLDVHVIVEDDHPLAPLRVGVGSLRQRAHRRAVERFEDAAAATREALERSLVELDKEWPDRSVEFIQPEEALVPQPREDPSVHQKHAQLRAAFVLRAIRARGDDHRPVMGGELLIRAL